MRGAVTRGGALSGVRVLDWTDESGRLAGKLLAEAGADVVRLRRGTPGPPLPGALGQRGGVLDWWFDAGTRLVPIDPATAEGHTAFRELAARADIVLASGTPEEIGRLGAHEELRQRRPALVQVSLTPYGLTGPRAGFRASDLVASALGGVLAVSGTAEQVQNGWGRQSFNVGSFYSAMTALVGLRRARETGVGVHVDLSLVQSVASCTEQVLMYWLHRYRARASSPRATSSSRTAAGSSSCRTRRSSGRRSIASRRRSTANRSRPSAHPRRWASTRSRCAQSSSASTRRRWPRASPTGSSPDPPRGSQRAPAPASDRPLSPSG
jgi:crotonobetainyl-CoA:carnitine CoA-transferase CaiB-like acyl-CoA transferase